MTVAWVTGGGTGIGRAVAERLLEENARVVITGRRKDIVEQAERDLRVKFPTGDVLSIAGDASDPAHVKDVHDRVKARWGAIDVLINNAGSNANDAFDNASPESYLESIRLNCFSAIHATRIVLPEMLARRRGSIVNICSIYARWSSSNSASYSVGKFALAGYTDALRQALVHTEIHVMGVFPGFIKTAMTQPFVEPGSFKSHFGKSPEQMAQALLGALSRKKAELYYPWYVPWVLRFHRWMPGLSDRLATRIKR